MNLLLINHNGFGSNSGIHVVNLANSLVHRGIDVAVAVPESSDAPPQNGGNGFTPLTWHSALSHRFSDGLGANLIHAWTPRQHVTAATRRIARAQGCGYIVHLEDNEYVITAAFMGMSTSALLAQTAGEPGVVIGDTLADPRDMQRFMEESLGVTALVDRLLEFKPVSVPGLEISPAAENPLFYPQAPSQDLRAEIGLSAKTKVLVYHGNAHPANVDELRSLYIAIAILARSRLDIVLLRLGTDHVEVVPEPLRELEKHVIKVPFQSRERLPLYLALADVFVQPGRIDDFNAYRFPSKLPEFFAMGRPVILPATNVGLMIADGDEGLLLHRGDALEIAKAIDRVLTDDALTQRLAAGARKFYERELDWSKSAAKLHCFYQSVLPKGLDD